MTGFFYKKAEDDDNEPPQQVAVPQKTQALNSNAQSSEASTSDLYLQLKSQKFRYEIEYLEECLPAAERIEK